MAPPARKTTVLVVEDDPAFRTFYRTALRIVGYTVISVEDGTDALRWVESDTPNLVILDMRLPRLGGLDVQKELKSRSETRHIPIMVVSGAETPDLDPADVACVIRKPVTAAELVAAVESV